VKATFIDLGQKSGTTQAVALVVIEAVALVGAAVIRSWMDKPANAINIAICVINFLNAIFLLTFTNIFKRTSHSYWCCGYCILFYECNLRFDATYYRSCSSSLLLDQEESRDAISTYRRQPRIIYQVSVGLGYGA
jgi:hypothetical protein